MGYKPKVLHLTKVPEPAYALLKAEQKRLLEEGRGRHSLESCNYHLLNRIANERKITTLDSEQAAKVNGAVDKMDKM